MTKRRLEEIGRTPPLGALYVFEVVARHLNLVRAADELGRTQSALSKQIRSLEDYLGVSLFVRTPRGLKFTEAGDVLRIHCRSAFGELQGALESVTGVRGRQSLRIAVARSYATRVLSHHVASFVRAYPDVDLILDGYRHLADIVRGEADAAIRVGDGKWTDVNSEKIEEDPIFPVASPALVARSGSDDINALMQKSYLIHFTERPYWEIWSRGAGIDVPRAPRKILVSESVMALEAAEAGQGLAIARRSLVREALRCGRLTRVSAIEVDDGIGYFFCATTEEAKREPVRRFRDWVFALAKGNSGKENRAGPPRRGKRGQSLKLVGIDRNAV